jgi:hypothetical protein
MTMNYSTSEKISSDEANLLALMQVDGAVLRRRADIDDPPVIPKRKPTSAETRAKIAAAVTGQKKSAETRAKIAASVSKARSKKSSTRLPPAIKSRRINSHA